MEWTNQQIDAVLDKVLPAVSKMHYERLLAALSASMGVGAATRAGVRDGDPINRMLWGVTIRARAYVPDTREDRTGTAWSYVDELVCGWAFAKQMPKESKMRPDAAWVAMVLGRGVDEVLSHVRTDAERVGISGFGF